MKEPLGRTRRPYFHQPQKNGDAFTADLKVLSDENESGLQHRYAVVVQDLSSCWNSKIPNEKQDCARNHEKLAKVRAARLETRCYSYETYKTNSRKKVAV